MALVHPDLSTLTSLRNKTILITGGSSGIGLATASLLSRLSPTNNLAILDLQPPSLFLQPPVSRVLFHRCDVTSWQDQRTGFAAATARFGRIDAVFVNAGIAEHQDQFFVDELDASGDLRAPDCRTLHIDLIAVAATVKLAIHYLRRSSEGGCIVLTSSLVGYLASAGAPLYSAAKHGMRSGLVSTSPCSLTYAGIIGLMRALKQETAKLNIAVSVVAPAHDRDSTDRPGPAGGQDGRGARCGARRPPRADEQA